MEQAREAKDPVQAEVWVELVAVVVALVAVRQQVLAEIVFVQTVVKKCHISWEPHATIKNVLSVELP